MCSRLSIARLLRGLALVLGLAGCGAGTAAVVAGGDSGSTSTPALALFAVEAPKVAPLMLRFESTRAMRIALFFDGGDGEQPMTGLATSGPRRSGAVPNEVDLGVGQTEVGWNFEADLDGLGFHPSVRLIAKRGGAALTGGELELGVGNDAPEVEEVLVPAEEVTGNVVIDLRVSDSSSDVVAIAAEWRRVSDAPDAWRRATPLGQFPAGIATTPEGVALTFVWNTTADLGTEEEDVLVRFRPDDGTRDGLDPVGLGDPVEGAPFRVDNNAAPLVLLDSGPLLANPDERRGIPVPYRLVDPEGDLVEVIFQWRREGEAFVPLDLARLDEILADPEERRAHHICSPFRDVPRDALEPIDATTVRIPALAGPGSPPPGVGEELALYRSAQFVDLATTWASNPLGFVRHALPLGDGRTALVVDAASFLGAQTRLREIELATGRVVRDLASLGSIKGLALEPYGAGAWIVLDDGAQWELLRLELASGTLTPIALGPTQGRGIGGVAALGTGLGAITLGRELLRVDATDPRVEPRVRSVFEGVEDLKGVVHDPVRPGRVYVAEQGNTTTFALGRVLSIDLDRGGAEPIRASGTPAFGFPLWLALENGGSRLLFGDRFGLYALELGVAGARRSRVDDGGFGSPFIATGAHGLRLVVSGRLYASGGLVQVASIVRREASSGVVVLAEPLEPPATPGQTARIWPGSRQTGTPAGRRGVFLWDSADVGDSADVYLRALPRDSDAGLAVETGVPKHVKGFLEPEPGAVGAALAASEILVDDMDQDGDLDLILARVEGVDVYFQGARGRFEGDPLTFAHSLGGLSRSFLATGDLDDDGDRDLVVAEVGGPVIWFQDGPGVFTRRLDLGGQFRHEGVELKDLDGDGDLDLVSLGGPALRGFVIYTQIAPGVFDPEPELIESFLREFALVAADLDADGDADLSAALFTGEIVASFQSSPGVFEPPTLIGSTGPGAVVRDLAAADLDGDGDTDLVSAGTAGLVVFLQETPGAFSPVLVSSQVSLKVAVRDLDGDERVDLLTNQGLAHLQVAPGVFDPRPRRFVAPEARLGLAFAVGDIDADGDPDVVTNGPESGFFVQLQARGRPRPSAVEELGQLSGTSQRLPAIVDIDADGDLDLLSGYSQADVSVLVQRSPGEFESVPRVLEGAGLSDGGGEMLALDLDDDGDLDLVRAGLGEHRLFVFLRREDGTFGGDPIVLGSGLAGGILRANDVDRNGLLDLLAAAQDPGPGVAVFLQTAPGAFTETPRLELTGFPSDLAVADLDGDGDADVAVVDFGSGQRLAVFHQVGPGEFDPVPLVLEEPEFMLDLEALDLDLDGRTDLILSQGPSSLDQIAYYQNGPPAFERVRVGVGLVGDLDGDGDVDALTRSFPEHFVSFNRSPFRSFDGFEALATDPFHSFSSAADFDGDGDLDLVFVGRDDVLNETTNTFAVFLNRRPGFEPEPLVLRVGEPNSSLGLGPIQVVDLDGDGERDLVGTTSTRAVVFWGGR